jgi:hypothetical protein
MKIFECIDPFESWWVVCQHQAQNVSLPEIIDRLFELFCSQLNISSMATWTA